MKTLLFLLIAANAMGQNDSSGVYLTFNDFLNNKLTYGIDCKIETHDIKQNDFANMPYITVFHKGQKIQLKKDSIYGYISCKGPLTRFVNKYAYYLSEKGMIWIFYTSGSVGGYSKGGAKVQGIYFFATEGDGEMIELTAANVKRAFPNNTKLHNLIDAQLGDKHICEYDPEHKMFKINQLLLLAQQEK